MSIMTDTCYATNKHQAQFAATLIISTCRYYSAFREMNTVKVLVTYRSITGNTKKIAEAIFGEIEVG
jgi:hypothetical protein